MSPDRLSRRVALSLVFLVVLVIAACKKEEAPPPTESAAGPAVSQTVSTAGQPLMAQTGGTTATDTAAVSETAVTLKAVAQLTAEDKENMFHPVVMVDSEKFTVDQKTVRLFDFEADANHHPTNRAVRVVWRTTSGSGTLVFNIPDSNTCITKPVCKPGECAATAKSQQKSKTQSTCTYELLLDGHRVDPVVVVDPCCP